MDIIYKLGKKSIKFRVFYTYCEFITLWLLLPFKVIFRLLIEVPAGLVLGILTAVLYAKENAITFSMLKDCLRRRIRNNG